MIGRFKANNPYNNILLFIYGLLLKLSLFINVAPPEQTVYDGILYKGFLKFSEPIVQSFPYWYACLSFLLFYIQALQLNKVAAQLKLFQKTNYLTGMSYLLITSLFVDWFSFSAILIVNSILIWVWAQLCGSHIFKTPKTSIFNIGFVISLASFFYMPAMLFILLMLLSIAITRPFKLQEWLVGIIGLITPVYFYAAWLYLTDNWQGFHLAEMHLSLPELYEFKWTLIAIISILAIAIMGWFFVLNNMRRQVVQIRKNWQLLYLYFFISLLLIFVTENEHFITALFSAVPLSMLVAAAFLYPEKKWFPLLAHWGLVILSIAILYIVK